VVGLIVGVAEGVTDADGTPMGRVGEVDGDGVCDAVGVAVGDGWAGLEAITVGVGAGCDGAAGVGLFNATGGLDAFFSGAGIEWTSSCSFCCHESGR
jgi:hypothetical protein